MKITAKNQRDRDRNKRNLRQGNIAEQNFYFRD